MDRVRRARWPELLPAVRELGVHGVCCFPPGIGAIRIGVLAVLCDGDRQLSQQQYADAVALSAMLTSASLHGEPRGQEAGVQGFGMGVRQPSGLRRAVVHQATGMVSVQLGVSMEEALLRLRAHVYGNAHPLEEVAEDMVARRLRFSDESDESDDGSGPHSPDGGKG
ncbi:ANTAR domain-containing protein [Streptomyces sp. NPDC102270]|uniref:ANTAR domain-containing protein n=1 Tax=Streptomyces sp. NPDC102270 TaxID=3366150 RepID=UPI00380F0222